jgi:hypothetical protein
VDKNLVDFVKEKFSMSGEKKIRLTEMVHGAG